ncbi:bifunctional acetate--CoA ligase family protein/GNAT family N-acetyltransferase [Pseudoduganella aquatica]|uniref:GNAT family N-acetyltransferase n=1 Tax=Pseudoduganella aquatica TaxID=2660641 RepID=A0A7X4HHV7_9BURK|nr:GNAT family N-acetyltransferase [Pseudoduganella aquatica]MYN10400.1 GNAT family N-acetyltransferase [Pseudoduganella aquatica]
MSIRNFNSLFDPGSVAVIGASLRPGSLGAIVLTNMAEGGYAGALWPVNPKYDELLGVRCYSKVSALPNAPDLAIICTPPATVPGLIAELGARGTRAAVVLSKGLDETRSGGKSARQAMLEAAKPHLLRILGPGGVGLLAPHSGLNASLAEGGAKAGKIAFVSQSDALMAAVLDWARLHGIGFSKFASLGERADIDLGDLLDFLADDSDTAAILVYMENLACARKFMSAARLAARAKPVIVLKAGRDASDPVYDAAFRRAGMLRVHSTEDLFDAAETLAHARALRGERLAIVANGGALGTIATDALAYADGKLAPLSPETVKLLRAAQPEVAAHGASAPQNPFQLGGAATPEQYVAAFEALLREPQVDAVLLIHAPATGVDASRIAALLAPLARGSGKNVLSCWLGGASVAGARRVFAEAGLPSYDTPEQAVRGFMQMAQYRRNQELLMEVPGQFPPGSKPERAAARAVIAAAMAEGRQVLEPEETRAVLGAYGIRMAEQGSAPPPHSDELAIGVHDDPSFGPVISLSPGGPAGARARADARVIGLPPLNMVLARDLLERSGLGDGGDAVCHTLIQVSDLVADTCELASLSIDPLLAGRDANGGGDGGVLALGARITLGAPRASYRLAIRAYPQELEQEVQWQGGPLTLRPIRPEDAPQHVEFFARIDPDDVRLRFFSAMRELQPAQLARLTQIDYDRAMAFIATRVGSGGRPETLGVVRAVADPDNQHAEFAILVRSDLKGKGLGAILFQKLVEYFRSRGTAAIVGEALSENGGVQQLVRRFGGTVSPSPEPGMANLLLKLQA